MNRLWKTGLMSLGVLALLLSVQAASAKAPAGLVKQTHNPITTLAIDSARVAYASGGKVYMLNVRTGATTLMRGAYNKHTAEVAIAGRHVAWITRYAVGNSEQTSESLFTGSLTTRARLLASGRRYLSEPETSRVWYGRWIDGAVGAGNTLAVSTWWSAKDGTCTAQKLSVVLTTRLYDIAKGPGAIVAASAIGGNAGHAYVAVLRSQAMWPDAGPPTPAVTVGIYVADSGRLVREITPTSAREIALTKNELVVLTETKTLEVYDWRKSGALLHTWPVQTTEPKQAAHLAAAGQLAVYAAGPGTRKLHLVQLTTGKDLVLASGKGAGYYARDAAMSPYGLVYAVNYRDHGKLVFVPMAKLLAKVSAG